MSERLRRALEHVDELPPDVQEEIAALIEARVEQVEPQPDRPDDSELLLPRTVRDALAVMGVWRDLQNDDEFAALDSIRHENTPARPVERDEL